MSRERRVAREFRFGDFHLLPGSTPHRETVLEPGDLITHVTLPPPSAGSKQVYLKLRDRASYEFALASAAVVLTYRGRKCDLCAHRPGRRGDKTVAVAGSRSRPDRQACKRRELSQGGRSCAARRQAAERERIQDRTGKALPDTCSANRRERLMPPKERNHADTAKFHDCFSHRPRHARVDGPLKVSGQAQYTSDFHFPGMLYAVPVESDDRERKAHQARYRRGREDAGRARDFSSREHRKDLPLNVRRRVSNASAKSAGRHSKTT